MRVAALSAKQHDRRSLVSANAAAGQPQELSVPETRLELRTSPLAEDEAISASAIRLRIDSSSRRGEPVQRAGCH